MTGLITFSIGFFFGIVCAIIIMVLREDNR